MADLKTGQEKSRSGKMKEVIIVGAGIGGLYCGAKLAKNGKRVLILEKNPHIGGTSSIFKRNGYFFPMGPLSISFPGRIKDFLRDVGVKTEIEFTRNHFQLLTPFLNIVYSHPLGILGDELKRLFPEESAGIDAFMNEMTKIITLVNDLDAWHLDFLIGEKKERALASMSRSQRDKLNIIDECSAIPAAEFLDTQIANQHLRNLLGSQGTSAPEMSMLNLAFMWNLMSEEGIWFPSCGIHGLSDMLKDVFLAHEGELKLASPVKRILIEDGMAVGVVTENNEELKADWVVSNVDQKRTFLELINLGDVPADYLDLIKTVPYTESELCVYLGVDPQKIDMSRMRANHLFYRRIISPEESYNPQDFDNQEIEICLWSANASDSVPEGRASLILRVSSPHEHFAEWRTGEKRRREGYREHKNQLAQRLIQTAENALPGLGSAVEVMEVATPLTYQDWGQRFQGSIAGWTWSAEQAHILPGKLLIETPIRRLLMVGIYAASELFLGGVPTSMHTASLAADIILERLQHRPPRYP
jgi:prolycopene isomerase